MCAQRVEEMDLWVRSVGAGKLWWDAPPTRWLHYGSSRTLGLGDRESDALKAWYGADSTTTTGTRYRGKEC